MRFNTMELDLPPCTPAQAALCEEFGEWCDRHDFARIPGDNPMLLNLFDRRQRAWLSNFIARWDWSTEDAALTPGALRTPLELAAAIVTVVREHCSRGEFANIVAGRIAIGQLLDLKSVQDLAFSRLHRVPIVEAPTEQQQRLMHSALQMVESYQFVRGAA